LIFFTIAIAWDSGSRAFCGCAMGETPGANEGFDGAVVKIDHKGNAFGRDAETGVKALPLHPVASQPQQSG
jgi:hypothetical protein